MKKNRFVVLLLVFTMVLCAFGPSIAVSESGIVKHTIDEAYEYPVMPGSREWDNLETRIDMINALKIPEEVLKGMTTEALLETVMNHPLLFDMYAFDTYRMGFEWILEDFDCLQELSSRGDSSKVMLALMNGLTSRQEKSENYFGHASIGLFLAQAEFSKKATKEDASKLDSYTSIVKNTPSDSGIAIAMQYYEKAKAEQKKLFDNDINAETAYIYTPAGTRIAVLEKPIYHFVVDEQENFRKKMIETYLAEFIDNGSMYFNCHSYSFYSSSTSNIYWIEPTQAKTYINDQSYLSGGGVKSGCRVSYIKGGTNFVHSARYDSTQNSLIMVLSKCGPHGIYKHVVTKCPYYAEDSPVSTINYWSLNPIYLGK